MAFDAGAIMGRLGLNTGPFAQGMLQAQSIAGLFPSVVTNFLANPLLGALGIIKEVTAGLVGMFKAATDRADDLGEMAANLGVSVETLSGMGLVAEQAGASVEAVADGMKLLGKNMAEAAGGSDEASASFDRLGISVVDSAGNIRPVEDVMMDLADALAALPAGAQRTQVAMDLLGRSGTELVGALSQGSGPLREQMAAFEEWGAVVTKEMAENAGKWNDLVDGLGARWRGVQNLFAEKILPGLLPELENLVEWLDANRANIQDFIVQTTEMLREMVPVVKTLADILIELSPLLQPIVQGISMTTGAGVFKSVSQVINPAAPLAASAGASAAGGGQTVNYNVTVQPPDAQAAATQMANQVLPKIQEAHRRGNQQLAAEARRLRVGRGL